MSKRLRPKLAAQGKAGWLTFMQDQIHMARLNVKDRCWTALDAPAGHEFMTSDIGIVKALATLETSNSWELGTFRGLRLQWLIPLSPLRAISVTDKAIAPPQPLSASAMRAVNRQLVLDAREFVYARAAVDFTVLGPLPIEPTIPSGSKDGIAEIRRGMVAERGWS